MAKRDDIKSQIKKQADEVYGENTMAGSSPDPDSDDNTANYLGKTVGAEINPGDEFHLADEVLSDERDRHSLSSDDSTEEQEEEEEI